MKSTDVNFENILKALEEFSAIIKKFADMLKAFVASWNKIPAAARDDADDVVDPYAP